MLPYNGQPSNTQQTGDFNNRSHLTAGLPSAMIKLAQRTTLTDQEESILMQSKHMIEEALLRSRHAKELQATIASNSILPTTHQSTPNQFNSQPYTPQSNGQSTWYTPTLPYAAQASSQARIDEVQTPTTSHHSIPSSSFPNHNTFRPIAPQPVAYVTQPQANHFAPVVQQPVASTSRQQPDNYQPYSLPQHISTSSNAYHYVANTSQNSWQTAASSTTPSSSTMRSADVSLQQAKPSEVTWIRTSSSLAGAMGPIPTPQSKNVIAPQTGSAIRPAPRKLLPPTTQSSNTAPPGVVSLKPPAANEMHAKLVKSLNIDTAGLVNRRLSSKISRKSNTPDSNQQWSRPGSFATTSNPNTSTAETFPLSSTLLSASTSAERSTPTTTPVVASTHPGRSTRPSATNGNPAFSPSLVQVDEPQPNENPTFSPSQVSTDLPQLPRFIGPASKAPKISQQSAFVVPASKSSSKTSPTRTYASSRSIASSSSHPAPKPTLQATPKKDGSPKKSLLARQVLAALGSPVPKSKKRKRAENAEVASEPGPSVASHASLPNVTRPQSPVPVTLALQTQSITLPPAFHLTPSHPPTANASMVPSPPLAEPIAVDPPSAIEPIAANPPSPVSSHINVHVQDIEIEEVVSVIQDEPPKIPETEPSPPEMVLSARTTPMPDMPALLSSVPPISSEEPEEISPEPPTLEVNQLEKRGPLFLPDSPEASRSSQQSKLSQQSRRSPRSKEVASPVYSLSPPNEETPAIQDSPVVNQASDAMDLSADNSDIEFLGFGTSYAQKPKHPIPGKKYRPHGREVYVELPSLASIYGQSGPSRSKVDVKGKGKAPRSPSLPPSDSKEEDPFVDYMYRARKARCQWDDCEATLDCASKLETHVRQIHMKSPASVLCRWGHCQRQAYKSRLDLVAHVDKSHFQKQPNCPYRGCEKSMSGTKDMRQHIKREHDRTSVLRDPALPISLVHEFDHWPLPSELPAYLASSLVVRPAIITHDLHRRLAPRILKSIRGSSGYPGISVAPMSPMTKKSGRVQGSSRGSSKNGVDLTRFEFMRAIDEKASIDSVPDLLPVGSVDLFAIHGGGERGGGGERKSFAGPSWLPPLEILPVGTQDTFSEGDADDLNITPAPKAPLVSGSANRQPFTTEDVFYVKK